MTIEAISWALNHAPVNSPTEIALLVGLANHAHGDGTCAWISNAKLADYARCSVRTVQYYLSELEKRGVIRRGDQQVIAHIPANRRPVVYDLAMELSRSGAQDSPTKLRGPGVQDSRTSEPVRGATDTGLGRENLASGVQAVADKPSTKPTDKPKANPPLVPPPSPSLLGADAPADDEPEVKPPKYPAAFEEFWSAYPRHVGKDAALRAWQKARRRALDAALVAGARRYANDPNLPEPMYVPHASTWLGRGGWMDEPCPPRHAAVNRADQRARDAIAAGERVAALRAARQTTTDHRQLGS